MARILRITTVHQSYLRQFFGSRPALVDASYADQQQALAEDCSTSGPAYSAALSHLGHTSRDVISNAPSLQARWAREHGSTCADLRVIAIRQAKEFRPEVLWFDSNDGELIRQLRAEVPSIRLAIGWEGSALSAGTTWRHLDLVLSCAPESVDRLRSVGVRSGHLNHGFDPSITAKLRSPGGEVAVSFVGSLIRRNQYHLCRDLLLTKLSGRVPLQIFTPPVSPREYCKVLVAGLLHLTLSASDSTGVFDRNSWPHCVRRISSPFRRPVNPALRRLCRPPVFGLRYFQAVRDSRVSLNIHADSSPRFASNMRLFEVTGVGSCLLTDDKPNLRSLFAPDSEAVIYRSADECAEKALWLLDHPVECRRIAERGCARTLRDHTIAHRAAELDQFIRVAL